MTTSLQKRHATPDADGLPASQAAAQARTGERIQSVLRLLIVVLVALQLALFPPRRHEFLCGALVVCFAVWAVLLLWRTWRREGLSRWTWRFLLLDLMILGSLLAVSGGFEAPVGVHPPVGDAFFLIPVLAAFQLDPRVTALMTGASALAYSMAAVLGRWSVPGFWPTMVHVLNLLLLGCICTLLSRVQRDRSRSVGTLMAQSRDLLGQAMDAEERERRNLAETLHNETLQNILAARHDLQEARTSSNEEALQRADLVLAETARQMRSVVTELHPVVLEHLGLAQAVHRLVANAEERGDIRMHAEYGDVPRFAAEGIAFTAARELLNNVVQHAAAHECRLDLRVRDGRLHLRIDDDGRGMQPGVLETSIRRGHIGLAALRVRIETAGGSFTLQPRHPAGTTALVQLPLGSDGMTARPTHHSG
ncbi:sensor histidine kinase [Kitasatospora hibisci]|uniref:sensor histidine kinase n=1 Tax=Kitasatospora hibisci TaxID=3369522 RepID=UPI0037548B9F